MTSRSSGGPGDNGAGGYGRVRCLFPDHLGLPRGKYLPAASAVRGSRHCMSLFALAYDRTMTDDPRAGAGLFEGLPDIELTWSSTDVRPGWEADTGVVVGDLHYDGRPFDLSPRATLRRAVADWERLGYSPRVGIELEAYVLEPDGVGGWQPWSTPGAFVYGTGPAVDPVGLIDEIMETAARVGLPVESMNSEYDSPQFELTLCHRDALTAADDAFLFKLMAREIAARHGLLLTFLGKPFADRSGSGLHVNLSLDAPDGSNAFADPAGEYGLSVLALSAVAGLIDHHEGLAALLAPTVNAYKRLVPGQLTGVWANWGLDHRGTAVRIPHERGAATRIEHRVADAGATPHLAIAAVLQAARLGVEAGATPPEPERLDCLAGQSTERRVPVDLSAALDALEADVELVEAVGRATVDNLLAVKRAEWAKWCAAITDWERSYYLSFV